MVNVTDTIENVLADHMFVPTKLRHNGSICSAGDLTPREGYGTDAADWRNHVAAVIAQRLEAK